MKHHREQKPQMSDEAAAAQSLMAKIRAQTKIALHAADDMLACFEGVVSGRTTQDHFNVATRRFYRAQKDLGVLANAYGRRYVVVAPKTWGQRVRIALAWLKRPFTRTEAA